MRARFLMGTCMAGLLALSAPMDTHAASLETELGLMLSEHPNLKAAEKTTLGTDKAIDAAAGALLPEVALTSDYGYEYITNPSERANSDGKNDSSLMKNTAGLTITQNLYDGQATKSSIRTAQLTKEDTSLTEETTRQALLFEGISAYLEVLKQVRRINSARENEANIKTQMELEDERVRRGSGIGIDVLNAKSRLQTAIDDRVEYEGDLAQASDNYIQVFGHAPDIAAMLDPNPPLDLLPIDLEDAIQIALRKSPAVLKADFAAEIARENKRSIKSEYHPTVDLVGSMNYEKDNNATIGTRRDWSVLVEANWTLFSGFSTQNSMKQAVLDYASSKDSAAFAERQTIEGTRRAWHQMQTNQERLELKENDLILKEEIFLSTRKQRESGAEGVDVLNVLDREEEVSATKIEYAELFYDTRRSIYSVLFAIGRLTPDSLGLE